MQFLITGHAYDIKYIGESEAFIELGDDLESDRPGITDTLDRSLPIIISMDLDPTVPCSHYHDIELGLVYDKVEEVTGMLVADLKFTVETAGFIDQPQKDYLVRHKEGNMTSDMNKVNYRYTLVLKKGTARTLGVGKAEAVWLAIGLETLLESEYDYLVDVLLPDIKERADLIIFNAFTSKTFELTPDDVKLLFLALASEKFKLSKEDFLDSNKIPKWYLDFCLTEDGIRDYAEDFEECDFLQI